MAAEKNAREELQAAMRTSTVTSSVSNTAPTVSVSGSGGGLGLVNPSLTVSTTPTTPPASSVLGGVHPSILVNPELLARIKQLLIAQGSAAAPAPSPPVAGFGQVTLPVAGQSQVPLLPPGLLAPAAPLPSMPMQAPVGPNILLGVAMAVSSPAGTNLERLVANQAMMFSHQHLQARNAQLEAAKLKVVGQLCSDSSV